MWISRTVGQTLRDRLRLRSKASTRFGYLYSPRIRFPHWGPILVEGWTEFATDRQLELSERRPSRRCGSEVEVFGHPLRQVVVRRRGEVVVRREDPQLRGVQARYRRPPRHGLQVEESGEGASQRRMTCVTGSQVFLPETLANRVLRLTHVEGPMGERILPRHVEQTQGR